MKNITVYHYSNKKITSGKISPRYFGLNYFTLRDRNACIIPRVYFFTDTDNIEYVFKSAKYCYIAEIPEAQICYEYPKYPGDIYAVIRAARKDGYTALAYDNIIVSFKPVKILKTDVNRP